MTKSPRERAEACFALARSSTFDGERAAAIWRGEAICARYRLDLDSFDIPGRTRMHRETPIPPPPSRFTDDLFRRSKAPDQYTAEEVRDVFRRFHESMAAMSEADAMRRHDERRRRANAEARVQANAKAERGKADRESHAFREAWRQSAEGVETEKKKPKPFFSSPHEAANRIWGKGGRVYQAANGADGSRRWIVHDADSLVDDIDDETLIQLAETTLTAHERVMHGMSDDLRSALDAFSNGVLYGDGSTK